MNRPFTRVATTHRGNAAAAAAETGIYREIREVAEGMRFELTIGG